MLSVNVHLEWMSFGIFSEIVAQGLGKIYRKDNLSKRFFPSNWNIVFNRLGDSCQVDKLK